MKELTEIKFWIFDLDNTLLIDPVLRHRMIHFLGGVIRATISPAYRFALHENTPD